METAVEAYAHIGRPPSPEERRGLVDWLRSKPKAPPIERRPDWTRAATPAEVADFATMLFRSDKPPAPVVVTLDLWRLSDSVCQAMAGELLSRGDPVTARRIEAHVREREAGRRNFLTLG
jgi:hypothetical protein